MLARILTAAILIPLVVALVLWGSPALLAAGAACVAIFAVYEFFELGEHVGLRAHRKWTMSCVAALFYAQYSLGLDKTHTSGGGVSLVRGMGVTLSIEAVLLAFVFGISGIGLATRRPLKESLPAAAISSAGILLIALPFSYVVRFNDFGHAGRRLLLFALVLIWMGDMIAYAVGRSLGRTPMAPALSPKKTWEGSIGNLLGSLLVAVCFARWTGFDTVTLVVIAALGNLAGQMGDLIESAYKRGAAVKDSGALLPGHGGVLDRIDSLILASPVVWVFCRWLLHANS
jgi:phosphatidate cytidylyltransferase